MRNLNTGGKNPIRAFVASSRTRILDLPEPGVASADVIQQRPGQATFMSVPWRAVLLRSKANAAVDGGGLDLVNLPTGERRH